jgi:hypothetical protein
MHAASFASDGIRAGKLRPYASARYPLDKTAQTLNDIKP